MAERERAARGGPGGVKGPAQLLVIGESDAVEHGLDPSVTEKSPLRPGRRGGEHGEMTQFYRDQLMGGEPMSARARYGVEAKPGKPRLAWEEKKARRAEI